MRDGWIKKKLGEVCRINSGKSIKASEIVFEKRDEFVPCYGGNGVRGYVNAYTYDGTFPIIGRVGALCGNVHLAEGKFYATEHALVVSNFSELVDTYWLARLLIGLDLKQYAKGVAQPVLSAGEISNIYITIPPISIQHRIVSELDSLSSIISKHKQLAQEYERLEQSIFQDMFGDPVSNEKGWDVRKMGELANFKNGLNFDKTDEGKEVYFIGVSDFQDRKEISVDEIGKINANESISDDYFLKENDIVFVRSNGSKSLIGRCMLVHPRNENVTFSGFCIRARLKNDECSPLFLLHILKTDSIRFKMTHEGHGCNISNINQKVLDKLQIPLPPISLQKQFVEKVTKIESLKVKNLQAQKEVELLFAERMNFYFGE